MLMLMMVSRRMAGRSGAPGKGCRRLADRAALVKLLHRGWRKGCSAFSASPSASAPASASASEGVTWCHVVGTASARQRRDVLVNLRAGHRAGGSGPGDGRRDHRDEYESLHAHLLLFTDWGLPG
jgi:hypothetical protein